MATETSMYASGDSLVQLDDVTWQTYCDLRDAPRNRHVRMTFDQGRLYLMSPSRLHERIAELLGRLIATYTEVESIPILSGGSTTMRDKLRKRGLEPDKCYYIQNEAVARVSDVYDALTHAPPDLAIEVDVTSMSTVRMPIYAALAVPEVWRWIDDQIEIHCLTHGKYTITDRSTCLPAFPFNQAIATLNERFDKDETSLIAAFRKSLAK